MNHSTEKLHRFGIKIFFEPGTTPDPSRCIPIFHRWIRERSLGGVLIDVADYTHLTDGPSVLLVGHEGNLSFDTLDQRAGLFYSRKRFSPDPFQARVIDAARMLFSACQLLEKDPSLDQVVRFQGNELQFVSNDRLVAPPDEITAREIGEQLGPLMENCYTDSHYEVTNVSNGNNRLRISLKSNKDISVTTLLSRII